MSTVGHNLRVAASVAAARTTALPALVRMLFLDPEDLDTDADTATAEIVDACAALLLTANDDTPRDALRATLQPLMATFALRLELPWEDLADAVLGTLSWSGTSTADHVLNTGPRGA